MTTSQDIIDKLLKKDSINLIITNTTGSVVQANILGNPDLRDNSNNRRSFTYDLTGETYGTQSITIQYRSNGQVSFTTVTLPLLSQTVAGVVDALNALGIGSWFYSGNNVVTYNDDYVFGTLTVSPTTSYAGQMDASFVTGTGFNNSVYGILQQADGKLIVYGAFTTYNGSSAPHIARLNTDGTLDGTFAVGAGFNNTVYAAAIQPDGMIVCGGGFLSFNGTGSPYIARIDTNGAIDGGFSTLAGFTDVVYAIALQADNKIVCGGAFSTGAGNTRITRLNTNGTEDGTFVTGTGFNFDVAVIVIQSDTKILIGGSFTTYNGSSARRIVRVDTNGAIDGTFVTGTAFNNNVQAIAVQADGKIICGGAFTTYNATPSNYIVRISSTGAYDATFSIGTGFNSNPYSIQLQADGKVLVAGPFTSFNGNATNRMVRLTTLGAYDPTFVIGTGLNSFAWSSCLQADTKWVVGGDFTTYNGSAAVRIVRVYTA